MTMSVLGGGFGGWGAWPLATPCRCHARKRSGASERSSSRNDLRRPSIEAAGACAVASRILDAAACPLSVYGQSKLAGELAIRAQAGRHLILRTGWIQSASQPCFVRSILQQAMAMPQLRVVDDQIGAPTKADLVAEVTARVLHSIASGGQDRSGIYHLVAGGETSWHGCARHALARAHVAGLPMRASVANVLPIPSTELRLPARRPLNSRLDTGKLRRAFGLSLPGWQEGIDDVVDAIVAEMGERGT